MALRGSLPYLQLINEGRRAPQHTKLWECVLSVPPWQQKIFSSTMAATGKQLKQSVKVFHSLILYRLLPVGGNHRYMTNLIFNTIKCQPLSLVGPIREKGLRNCGCEQQRGMWLITREGWACSHSPETGDTFYISVVISPAWGYSAQTTVQSF